MLSESLLISLQAPSTITSLPKDASLFHYLLAPQPGLLSTYKKSSTPPHCLAASRSHVFTAQGDKALVHVYSRETGALQTTVPFRERITSLALVDDGFTVVCGIEAGAIIVWETLSGRTVKTGEGHLGAVRVLVTDRTGLFALSGSDDGNVAVWNLGAVRAWGDVGPSMEHAKRAPMRTLRSHREGIRDLKIGRGMAVSCAGDGVRVWDYMTGGLLRTILLPESPRCVALDPCDRALFVGFADGAIAAVDFFGMDGGDLPAKNPIWDESKRSMAVQVSEEQRWTQPGEDIGETSCMEVSFDSTKLITGHTSGKIIVWDIPSGSYHSQLASTPLPGPITNIEMLSVEGHANKSQVALKIKEVVKPKFGELDSTDGQMPANYKLTAHLVGRIHLDQCGAAERPRLEQTDFERGLCHPAFPPDVLADSIADLSSWQQRSSSRPQVEQQADFMALDEEGANDATTALQVENTALKTQIAALQRLQKASFALIEDLKGVNGDVNGSPKQSAAQKLRQEIEKLEEAEESWNSTNGTETKSKKAKYKKTR